MSIEKTSSLEGKIAIVTGGSRGLGRNTVFHLARRGVRTILTYNSNRAEAEKAVAEAAEVGGKAVALQLDAGDVRAFDLSCRTCARCLESGERSASIFS